MITSSIQQPSAKSAAPGALKAARDFVQDDLTAAYEHLKHVIDSSPGEIPGRLSALLSHHGKQIRSSLLLLFSRMGEEDCHQKARLGAAAVELLHTASLAHDDVIDEARMRRGTASAPERWGNKMAVLVGDYALARSIGLINETHNDDVIEEVIRTSCTLVAGEIAEFDFAREKNPTLDGYRKVIYGKTAILLECSCLSGAAFAHLPKPLIEAAAKVGAAFGMAFQMCDDLLDLGNTGDLDKPAHIDLQNGLLSLPALLEREINHDDLRDWLVRGADALLEHLRSTGVLVRARELIQAELSEAARQLAQFPESTARSHVTGIISDLQKQAEIAIS